VRSFSETIMSQFDEELAAIESKGIKGLIVDMRGNPGGLLSAAVEMCGRFLDGKQITTMKMRGGEDEVFISPSGWSDQRTYPVAILIDENSASAAEIFAGAMKDYHRATIVGKRSYGKGSVQRMLGMADGSQIKLTIARYYLPNGESIQRRETDEGEFISGGITTALSALSLPARAQDIQPPGENAPGDFLIGRLPSCYAMRCWENEGGLLHRVDQ
jgi:carboxyl-terminal processing protease